MFEGKVSRTTVIVVAIFTTVPMLYSIYHTPKIKTAKPFQKCHAATPCDIPFKVTVGPTTFKNPTEAEAGCRAAGFDRLCDKAAVKSANQNQCGAGWTSDGAGWWRRDESPGDACGRAQQWNDWEGPAAAHCCHKIRRPNASGLPLCKWQVISTNGGVLYPRGIQTYSPQVRDSFEAWGTTAYDEYVRASWLIAPSDRVAVLDEGSMLAAVVGGDWSHDNDLDVIDTTKDRACQCYYSGRPAVCLKDSVELARYQQGIFYWLPLRTKNIGPAYNDHVRGNMYRSWYAKMFETPSQVQGWWHGWRLNAIGAFQGWDSNKNGNISLSELVVGARQVVNREWMAEVSPCLFYNSAVQANAMLHHLVDIEKLYNKHKENATALKTLIPALTFQLMPELNNTDACRHLLCTSPGLQCRLDFVYS